MADIASLDELDHKAAQDDASAMENLLGDLEAPGATPPAAQPAPKPGTTTPPAGTQSAQPAAPTPEDKGAGTDAGDKGAGKSKTGQPGEEKGGTAAGETDEQKQARLDKELEDEVEQALKDLPQVPKNAPKHVHDALKAMKGKLKDEKRAVREAREAGTSSARERDELRQRIEQYKDVDLEKIASLQKLEKAMLAERDPEFVAKYVEPANQKNAEALQVLRSFNIPDPIAKWIEGEGGVLSVYQSDKPVLDDKGEPMKTKEGRVITQAEWFEANILTNPNLTVKQRNEIKDAIDEARQANRSKDRALNDLKKGGEAFLNERDQAEKKRDEEIIGEFDKAVDAVTETLGVAVQLFEPKPEATPEQRKAIEAHNERVKKGVAIVQAIRQDILEAKNVRSKDFGKRLAEIAVAAAQAEYLADTNTRFSDVIKDLQKENKELKDRLEGMKRKRNVTDPDGGGATPSGERPTEPPPNETDEQAMERHMQDLPPAGAQPV